MKQWLLQSIVSHIIYSNVFFYSQKQDKAGNSWQPNKDSSKSDTQCDSKGIKKVRPESHLEVPGELMLHRLMKSINEN